MGNPNIKDEVKALRNSIDFYMGMYDTYEPTWLDGFISGLREAIEVIKEFEEDECEV